MRVESRRPAAAGAGWPVPQARVATASAVAAAAPSSPAAAPSSPCFLSPGPPVPSHFAVNK